MLQLDHAGPYRVLVIDDGSDDDTATIVASYGDARVHLLRRTAPDCRNGKGEALNAAYRHLIGDSGILDRDPDQVRRPHDPRQSRLAGELRVDTVRGLGRITAGRLGLPKCEANKRAAKPCRSLFRGSGPSRS